LAHLELGNIALLEDSLAAAESSYKSVLNLYRADTESINTAKYKLARVHFFKEEFSEALQIISQILYNLKDKFANDALELSLLLNTSMSDSSNIRLFAYAEFLLDKQKFSEAAETYKLISEDPRAFVLHSIAKLRFAEMKLAENNYNESMKILEEIIDEGEKNIYADKALYLLGGVYQFGIGDNLNATEIYEQLLAQYPKSIYIDDVRERILYLKENPS
jgi:predicted negative regulator of RcsB-dependent stress response